MSGWMSIPQITPFARDSRDGSFCHVVIDMGENVCQHRIDQAEKVVRRAGKSPGQERVSIHTYSERLTGIRRGIVQGTNR